MRKAACIVGAGAVLAGAMAGVPVDRAFSAEDRRPNIVLVTTDDMNDYDVRWMPKTRALIREQGTELTDFISPHPLCCPARAELYTGQYAHNNGVHHNYGLHDGNALKDPNNNVGEWVQDGGYRTGFVGKFLNGFNRYPVAGWHRFDHSLQGANFNAFNTAFSGTADVPDDLHSSDYVGRQTVRYVKAFSKRPEPFFIWTSQIAPHNMKTTRRWPGNATAIPAKRHRDLYSHAMPPSLSKPSFNEADMSDKVKHSHVQKVRRSTIITNFRQRIRSLRSVDDQVGRLVNALAKTGELENTVILFTSDNGYLLGEHRLIGKNYAYEEALQVPMLARGPAIPVGTRSDESMTLVDVPATIADLAGVEPQRVQDGRSILPVLNGAAGYSRELVQAGHRTQSWGFRGVRDARWTYAEFYDGEAVSDKTELYDRDIDPYQLENLAGQRPEDQAVLAKHLSDLRDCASTVCYQP